jgi:predicted Zn-dependent peptidase
MKFKKTVLENGLTIITSPAVESQTVTVLTLVSTGSDYETVENNGISHFLEHMCFKGTDKRTCSEINIELDSAGATSNAFTSNEYTGYYAKAHHKKLPVLLDVVSDIYLNSTFPKDDIEKERGVIIEEINMYEDLPKRKVWDELASLMYKGEPAGRTILGPINNIKNISQEDFIKYKKDHYVAKGTTVVVSGKFDQSKVIKEIKNLFKDVDTNKKVKRKKTKFTQSKPQVAVKYKKTDQTHLLFGVNTFPIKDKRNITLSLLSTILGGGMSSRLFTEMRDKRGLCYYTFSHADRSTDRGILAVGSGVGHKKLEESVEVIMNEFRKLRDEEVSPKELKKAKDYLIGNMAMSLEGSDDVAMSLGMQELLKGDIKKPQEKFREIRKVTSADIKKLAKQIFVDNRLNFAAIGPLKDDKKIKKILKF